MDKRLLFVLFAVLGSILVLCCCSQVFEAGISGKVVTEVGTDSVAVSDVNVFAYTDKSARDSDYEEFKAGTRTRPSEKAGYVATTTTNANGEFVVNKIVWETKKSKYGKTADVNKLYLIFYHDDYDVATEDATVISDSTNQSNVYVTLKGNKDYTTLNITVKNVATNAAMTDSCTLEYKVEGKDESDSVVVTGTTSIRISYPKGTTPDVTFTLTSPGSGWKMCDDTGALIDSQIEEDVDSGTLVLSLFMKSYEFTLPGFSGDIDGSLTDLASPNSPYKAGVDNVEIKLSYWGKEENAYKWIPFDDVTILGQHKTQSERVQQGTEVYYQHGLFSSVGNSGYSIVINENSFPGMGFVLNAGTPSESYDNGWSDLVGKTTTIRLKLTFVDVGEKTFNYTIGTSSALRHITIAP